MLPRFPASLLLTLIISFSLTVLPSPARAQQKLDSLLRIHDTTTVVFYTDNLDSLALQNFHTIRSTKLTGFQRYNPLHANKDFYASFANTGLAYRNLTFQPDLNEGFYDGLNTFDVYTFTNESIRYYQHLIPITYLSYDNGAKKEQLFRVMHSTNIAKTVTFGVDFFLINSPGAYDNSKSDDKSVAFTGQYFTKDLRFGATANFRNNVFIVRENGGIVADSIFEEQLETDPTLIDVRLTTAQNKVRDYGINAQAYFYLSRGKPKPTPKAETFPADTLAADSITLLLSPPLADSVQTIAAADSVVYKPKTFHAGRIMYEFDYRQQRRIYSDSDPLNEFYQQFGPVIDSNETYDSLRFITFDQRFSWSNLRLGEDTRKKPMLVIFAIRNQHTVYADTLNERQFNSWIPEARIVIRPYRTLAIDLFGNFTFGDFNSAGFKLQGTATQLFNLKNGRNIAASFRFVTSTRQAGYFYHYHHSNYFRWDTTFSHQKIMQTSFSVRYADILLKLDYNLIGDYVYLDQEARPAQHSGSFSVLAATLKNEFRWRKWSVDASLVYQAVSNKDILRLPDLMARVSLFPTLPLFQNAAVLQPGVDLLYTTAYYADAYMPALRMFYLQDEKKIGNYLYADVFVNLMVKRFRIFAKYEHVNGLWSKHRYYMVPHYPSAEPAFKFGLSWSFYD